MGTGFFLWGCREGGGEEGGVVKAAEGGKGERTPSEASGGRIEVVPLFHAETSGYRQEGHQVIADVEAWRQFWSLHTANRLPPEPLPEVDFAHQVVLVASRGEKPTSGYDVGIVSVDPTPDQGLKVRIRHGSPAPEAILAHAITAPITAVKVTRPRGRVEFVVEEGTGQAGPPPPLPGPPSSGH